LEPGLAALARLADEGAAAAFERFQTLWGEGLASWILTRAEELGQSLEEHQAPATAPAAPVPEPKAVEPTSTEHEPARTGRDARWLSSKINSLK
jgi:hypothetical protein